MIDMIACDIVCMGMVKVHASAIEHFELIDESFALINRVQRMPVHLRWHMQPVPVRDGRSVKLVLQIDADFLAFFKAQQWPKIRTGQFGQGIGGAFNQFCKVLQDPG